MRFTVEHQGVIDDFDQVSYREAVRWLGEQGWRPCMLSGDGWRWEVFSDGTALVRAVPPHLAGFEGGTWPVGTLLSSDGTRSIFDDVDE